MRTTISQTKVVQANSSLEVISLKNSGKRHFVLIDQDGDAVGLKDRSEPYYMDLNTAKVLANKGMREGEVYKSYSVKKCGKYDYILDCYVFESVTASDEMDSLISQALKIKQEAEDLYRQVSGKEFECGCIEGEFVVKTNTKGTNLLCV